jgi:hypothetical protein
VTDRTNESTSQRANERRTSGPPLTLALLPVLPALLVSIFLSPGRTLAAPPPPKSPAALTLRWQPGTYHLGDAVPFEVAVPLGAREFFIEGDLSEGTDWGDATILKVRQELPAAFPGTLRIQGEVQVFDVGSITLPPLAFAVHVSDGPQPYSLKAPPLTIQALLPPGSQPKPPIAAPLAIPAPFPWAWAVGGLLLAALLGLGGFLLYRRLRRAKAEPRAKPDLKEVDPDRWIREEIEKIFRAPAEAPVRYQKLSEALRQYLSIRFGKPFPEWTTAEVSRGLGEIDALRGVRLEDPLNLLAFCDVVMFARYRPQPEEEQDAREIALEFLDTIQRPRELEAAS